MTTHIAHVHILTSARQHRFATPFSYTVPTTFDISIGMVVYVPFRSRIVIGIVLSITVAAHTDSTLKALIAPSGIHLLKTQIDLAQWMSRYYACPLSDVFALFIPTYAVTEPHRYWQCTDAGHAVDLRQLPPDERDVLYAVRKDTVLHESTLGTTFRGTPQQIRTRINHLIARGYLSEQYQILPPAVLTQSVRMVTLINSMSINPRARAQADVITQLQAAPHQTLPASHIAQKAALKRLVDIGIIAMYDEPLIRPHPPQLPPALPLTHSQQRVVESITAALGQHHTFLIDGVTGSGKTEVYCVAIRALITQQRQTLVLIPEIALTTQLAQRFEARFPGRVVLLHGQLTPKQRIQRWHDIQANHYDVIIGPRSALFAPIPRLGLIIVDEEHDASYKSDAGIRYHARDSAIMYAKLIHCPVVLGSATPSVEIIEATQSARITRLVLAERVDSTHTAIPRPPIRMIDMRSESCIDPYGLIGVTLADRIHEYVTHKHHVLLLLNRRGSISARICRQCSATDQCTRCSTPLVIHQTHLGQLGICHSCGNKNYVNSFCSQCFHTEFLDIGGGTQRLSEVVHQHWATVPVIRWDSDTADSARMHATLLNEIASHECAIIVGTQMIAKGFDIPNIRLVGVVNTDTALNLPDIRAAERTYQLLTQVAGRAGRRAGASEVIFQTYKPEHYAIHAAARYDSELFYQQELQYRRRMNYPPYTRCIRLVWRHVDAQTCERLAHDDVRRIHDAVAHHGSESRIIGPAPCFFSRVRNQYRWQVIIVTHHPRSVLAHILDKTRATIDVDPISLL